MRGKRMANFGTCRTWTPRREFAGFWHTSRAKMGCFAVCRPTVSAKNGQFWNLESSCAAVFQKSKMSVARHARNTIDSRPSRRDSCRSVRPSPKKPRPKPTPVRTSAKPIQPTSCASWFVRIRSTDWAIDASGGSTRRRARSATGTVWNRSLGRRVCRQPTFTLSGGYCMVLPLRSRVTTVKSECLFDKRKTSLA